MQERFFISAINATVYFGGHEVGHLQNLRITENYNLQRLRTFWQPDVQAFVPGISEFAATAQKAFVEYESVLGNIQEILKTIDALKQVGQVTGVTSQLSKNAAKVLSSVSSGVESILSWVSPKISNSAANVFGKVSSILTLSPTIIDLFNRIANGVASLGEVFSNISFDVRVKNPIIKSDSFGTSISPIFETDLWVLRGCQLNSREMEISIGNVIIMENVTLFARKNYDGMTPSIASGFIPFS